MQPKTVNVYATVWNVAKSLPKANGRELIWGFLEYMFDEEAPSFKSQELQNYWSLIKPAADNQKNGMKGAERRYNAVAPSLAPTVAPSLAPSLAPTVAPSVGATSREEVEKEKELELESDYPPKPTAAHNTMEGLGGKNGKKRHSQSDKTRGGGRFGEYENIGF